MSTFWDICDTLMGLWESAHEGLRIPMPQREIPILLPQPCKEIHPLGLQLPKKC